MLWASLPVAADARFFAGVFLAIPTMLLRFLTTVVFLAVAAPVLLRFGGMAYVDLYVEKQ